MSLPTAQLGQLSNIQLPTSAPQKRPSVWEQALASFIAGMGNQLGDKLVTNAFSRDYAPDGQKAGFFAKLGNGPVVDERTYLFNKQQDADAARQAALLAHQTSESDKTRKASADEGAKTRTHQSSMQVSEQNAYMQRLREQFAEEAKNRASREGLTVRGQDMDSADKAAGRKLQEGQFARQMALEELKNTEGKPLREAQVKLIGSNADAARFGLVKEMAQTTPYIMPTQNKDGTQGPPMAGEMAEPLRALMMEYAGKNKPSAQAAPADDPLTARIRAHKEGGEAQPGKTYSSPSQKVFTVDNLASVTNPFSFAYHVGKQLYGNGAQPASDSAPKAVPAPPAAPQTGPSGPPTTPAPAPAVVGRTKDGIMIDDGQGLDIGSMVSPFTGASQETVPSEDSPFTAPTPALTEEEIKKKYLQRFIPQQYNLIPTTPDA